MEVLGNDFGTNVMLVSALSAMAGEPPFTALANQAGEGMDRAQDLVETMPSKSVQHFVQFEDMITYI